MLAFLVRQVGTQKSIVLSLTYLAKVASRLFALALDFGYTDLMVDGAPLPHQPDTIIRWLIDRPRS